MKTLLPFLLAAFLLTGCGSTERISRSHLKVRAFELNLQGLRGPVTVSSTNSRVSTVVEHFNILGDSAMWIEPESRLAVGIPNASLERIVYKDRVAGGLWGMAGGILFGASIGSLTAGDENSAGTILTSMLIGEVSGLLLGSMIGVDSEFIIEP